MNIFGTVKRNEMIKEETEMMFPDAKKYTEEQRLAKNDIAIDWYFAKMGDQRFKIKNQIAKAKYQYEIEITSKTALTEEQIAQVQNVIDSVLMLKGEKIIDSTKSIEKVLKRNFGIVCSIDFLNLQREFKGGFKVEHEAFDEPITVDLVSVESDKIVEINKENEATI